MLRHLVGDRHAAARQAEHDGPSIGQAFEFGASNCPAAERSANTVDRHRHLHLGLAMAILSAMVASRWAISAASRSSRWPVRSCRASSRLSSSSVPSRPSSFTSRSCSRASAAGPSRALALEDGERIHRHPHLEAEPGLGAIEGGHRLLAQEIGDRAQELRRGGTVLRHVRPRLSAVAAGRPRSRRRGGRSRRAPWISARPTDASTPGCGR